MPYTANVVEREARHMALLICVMPHAGTTPERASSGNDPKARG